MVMTAFLVALGVLLVGASVGAAYARAEQQWAYYRRTRKALPNYRTKAWLLTRIFGTKAGLVTAAVIVLAVYAWFADGGG